MLKRLVFLISRHANFGFPSEILVQYSKLILLLVVLLEQSLAFFSESFYFLFQRREILEQLVIFPVKHHVPFFLQLDLLLILLDLKLPAVVLKVLVLELPLQLAFKLFNLLNLFFLEFCPENFIFFQLQLVILLGLCEHVPVIPQDMLVHF